MFDILSLHTDLTKDSDKKNSLQLFMPNYGKVMFGLVSIVSLLSSSYVSYLFCGRKYIEEAWLYHFYRQDLQHNFSPAFYFLNHIPQNQHQLISLLYFLPQFFFIIYVAYSSCRSWRKTRSTPVNPFFMALFVQTFIFVTWNKVITAQYFEWYLCLLPLVAPAIQFNSIQWLKIFLVWGLAIIQWLLPAYLWEFEKLPVYHWLGFASILFATLHTWVIIK